MKIVEKTETRVRFIPITPYALRFWMNDEPKTYSGNHGDGGGPDLPATPKGFINDGFAMSNYLGWAEERTVYVVEPEPWEVV